MAHLHDIRYVRLGTDRLNESVEFATQILGLELVGRDSHSAYLRGDNRDHNVCYVKGARAGHAVGFEVSSSALLDVAASELEEAGLEVRHGRAEECEQRRVRAMIQFIDPTGNSIELVARPGASGVRYFPSRDAGITSFSHVGLRTTDAATDEAFWTTQLGAKVSDWIGDAALLRIDGVHHKIALFPSSAAGVQHINFQVAEIDDVMRSWYFLKERGVRIAFGPGRHPTSGARFLYFYGPDDMIYEYSCGVRVFSEDEDRVHVPRQFPKTPRSYCAWGSVPDIAEFRAGPHAAEVDCAEVS